MEKLRQFLNQKTPQFQNEFALSCNTTISYLRKAISNNELLNPKLCVSIERESDEEVTRKHLRPDDWHEVWPELVEAA
jgi:DNA-binding transcriptional regulator YdaS (Cro superfamily)